MVSRRTVLRNALLGVCVAVCLAALVWPVYAKLGASIEPFVLGLPWSLVWVVGCCCASFVAVLLYHVTGDDERS